MLRLSCTLALFLVLVNVLPPGVCAFDFRNPEESFKQNREEARKRQQQASIGLQAEAEKRRPRGEDDYDAELRQMDQAFAATNPDDVLRKDGESEPMRWALWVGLILIILIVYLGCAACILYCVKENKGCCIPCVVCCRWLCSCCFPITPRLNDGDYKLLVDMYTERHEEPPSYLQYLARLGHYYYMTQEPKRFLKLRKGLVKKQKREAKRLAMLANPGQKAKYLRLEIDNIIKAAPAIPQLPVEMLLAKPSKPPAKPPTAMPPTQDPQASSQVSQPPSYSSLPAAQAPLPPPVMPPAQAHLPSAVAPPTVAPPIKPSKPLAELSKSGAQPSAAVLQPSKSPFRPRALSAQPTYKQPALLLTAPSIDQAAEPARRRSSPLRRLLPKRSRSSLLAEQARERLLRAEEHDSKHHSSSSASSIAQEHRKAGSHEGWRI